MEVNTDNAQVLADLGLDFNNDSGNNDGFNSNGGQGSSSSSANAPTPSELFGDGINDWETAKAENTKRMQDYHDLRTKYDEISARPNNDFADDEVAEYNSFVKNTGIKDFNTFKQVKGADDNLDAIEAFVLKKVIENPDLRGKEDLVRRKIIKDFGLDEDLNSPDDIEMNQITLKEKSKEVYDWLKDMKGKLNVPKTDKEALNKAVLEKESKWLEAAEKVINGVSKLQIPTYSNGKVEILTDFDVKPEIAAEYKTAFAKAFSGYDLNEQNVQAMESEFRDKFVARNLPHIVSHALAIQEAKLRQEFEDKYDGPMTRPKPPGGGGTTSGDILDDILNALD